MIRHLTACLIFVAVLFAAARAEDRPPAIEPLADNLWIHKSYRDIPPWGPILSHGLIVRSEDEVVLVDSAWTDEETRTLLDLIDAKIGAAPARAVVTHAHDDKMGGVGALHAAGVVTIALDLTNRDAPGRGLVPAVESLALAPGDAFPLTKDIEIFYPGPAHTRDNIVVYHGPTRTLFGGCLVRPGRASTLGNTADADVSNWAAAARALKTRYPDAAVVIPSHGPPGGPDLLDHTIALAEAAGDK